jgi:ribosome-interacting GTPase 1
MITAIAKEYKINNADITFRQDCNVDQLIDVIEGNRKYIPALYVLNKVDTITLEELELLSQVPNYVPVCAGKEW